jgi:hypothetical protein
MDIKDQLTRVAATPRTTPYRIDIEAARRSARRIRRTRLAAAATGVVAVAGLAVAGLPHLTQGQYAASPARHPDPLIEHAPFGWLPAGFAYSGVSQDEQLTQTTATPTSDAVRATLPPDTRNVAYISLMEARGTRPDLDKLTGGLWAHRTVAPPVNGHPAYWVVPPGRASVGQPYDAELWWQNQPGHWVAVETVGLIPADIAGTVGRIARTITFGRARPVPMPLRATGLPAGLP